MKRFLAHHLDPWMQPKDLDFESRMEEKKVDELCCREAASVIGVSNQEHHCECDWNISGIRKCSRAQSSTRLFCSGVPNEQIEKMAKLCLQNFGDSFLAVSTPTFASKY